MKEDKAFSGLEAAIVLIAFVVVAAVFSYVMLGAGFFATSKAQEVTYSGVKQSTSNEVLDGYIYGSYATQLNEMTFFIKVPEGGETAQLSQNTYLYTALSGQPQQVSAKSGYGDTGSLAPGMRTKIVLNTVGSFPVKAGQMFSLEIKPRVGASYLVQRTLSNGYSGGVIY